MTRHPRIFGPSAKMALLAIAAMVLPLLSLPQAAGAVAPGAPTQPGPIAVTSTTMNSAVLTWGASFDTLGVEGYQIYRQQGGGTSALIATTDGGVTHYNARNLYASTNYAFNVIAIDTSAQMSTAQTTAFTTLSNPSTTPPLPPSDASVAAKAFSDTRIDVVWAGSTSADVSGYRVLRDGLLAGRVDLPGGLRFSDNGLAAGTHYVYTIEAVDSAGNISAPTTPKLPAGATTLVSGTAQIARGPYLSNVTGTSAVVSWWTNIPTPGTVNFGVASTAERSQVDPASPVQHHAVTISGLTPTTAYKYTVGNGATVSSLTATFKTAAGPGTPFSFAAIGDFGGGSPGEAQNATNIAGAGTSFIQTLGDNIYPSAGVPEPNFTTTYSDYDARFFKQFGPAIKNQPLFPANGNQEYYSGGKAWDTFPMPGGSHSWYSYDWGNAHILVLDSELSFDPASAQYLFAQSDLSTHQSATWRIVVMQRPPYSSTSANSSSKKAQTSLVPLFEQNHVALVLSGNSHNYERSFPLKAGSPASGGVTYVVSGGGGNGFNAFNDTTFPKPAWSAMRESSYYEYAKVTVSPTALTVAAVRADTNAVFDSTVISAAPSAAGSFASMPPQRLLDTRNGTGAPKSAVAARQTVHLPVTGGTTGVPTGASAVVLNVTATQPTQSGFLTAYPDLTTMPVASNLNFVAGQTVPNLVIVKVGTDGKVALTNSSAGSVQLVADIAGYYL